MRVLADIERSRGNLVTGSDAATGGHDANNVRGADLVVYTSAVGEQNVELVEARRLGIPVIERARLLGIIAGTYEHTIAVTGAHGKTTVTGMLASIFRPRNPTVHIGGKVGNLSSCVGGGAYFITEACEYRRSFLSIKAETAIVLNIDLDHTDYYRDLADVKSAFIEFTAAAGRVIVSGDDPECACITGDVTTVGESERCDWRATCLECDRRGRYSFCVLRGGKRIGRFSLGIAGRHNVSNALAAIACAHSYGFSAAEISLGLASFTGAARRFERLGNLGRAEVISDYAHHPREIASSIATAREIGCEKIVVVFQPHTYTRTQSLMDEFVTALSGADEIILAPIFPAREAPIAGVSSHNLVRKLLNAGARAVHMDTFSEIISYCRGADADAVIFMGAGDIDKAGRLCVSAGYTLPPLSAEDL